MNNKSDTAEVVHIYRGTTDEKVDALISDLRDLLQATEVFHARNSSEHHHIEGRLAQIENVLHSISARLNIALQNIRRDD